MEIPWNIKCGHKAKKDGGVGMVRSEGSGPDLFQAELGFYTKIK